MELEGRIKVYRLPTEYGYLILRKDLSAAVLTQAG